MTTLLQLGLVLAVGPAQAAEPPTPATVTAAPGRGLTVTSGDGRFSIGLRARFQLRQTLDVADGDVALATQLATARIWVAGHLLSPDVRYLVQLAVAQRDFRDGATSPVFDAYFDLTHNPNLSFRVGQIFVPFDRLRTIRELALQFSDRPRAVSELTLDRDIGVYAYSDHLGGDDSPVAYRIGLFGGSGIHQLAAHPPGGLGGGVNVYWNGHAFKLQSSVIGFVADDGTLAELNARVALDATV